MIPIKSRTKARSKRLILKVTKLEIYCEDRNEPLFVQNLHVPTSQDEEIFGTYSLPLLNFPRFIEEREQLVRCINQLKESFDDVQNRQIFFVSLRSLLVELRNKLTLERPNFLRLINMCIDALDNTRSEVLTEKQVETIGFLLKEMDENIDDYTVEQAQEILFRSGLKPIPNLEGIAKLYKY